MTSVSKTNDNGQPAVKAEPKNRIAEVEKTDPFDNLDSLRLSQDYAAQAPVKKVLTTVPCRKPNRHEFVRVRAGEDWRFETTAFEDKVNRETYLVSPELRAELFDETFNVCLFVTTNRQKDIFLWPVRLPGHDGKSNNWNDSAVAAAQLATTRWVRVASNMGAGLYDTFESVADIDEPLWPEYSLQEILKLSFRTRFIQDVDHPVMRALRGEV